MSKIMIIKLKSNYNKWCKNNNVGRIRKKAANVCISAICENRNRKMNRLQQCIHCKHVLALHSDNFNLQVWYHWTILCSYCLCWCSIHFLRSWISTWFSISSAMPYAPYCIAFMHEFLGGQSQKLTHTHARTHKHKWNWNIVKWTFAKIRSIN